MAGAFGGGLQQGDGRGEKKRIGIGRNPLKSLDSEK